MSRVAAWLESTFQLGDTVAVTNPRTPSLKVADETIASQAAIVVGAQLDLGSLYPRVRLDLVLREFGFVFAPFAIIKSSSGGDNEVLTLQTSADAPQPWLTDETEPAREFAAEWAVCLVQNDASPIVDTGTILSIDADDQLTLDFVPSFAPANGDWLFLCDRASTNENQDGFREVDCCTQQDNDSIPGDDRSRWS